MDVIHHTVPSNKPPFWPAVGEIDLGMCQCCNQNPAYGVAASSLGPLSIAWCTKCLHAGVEPYWLVMATASMCGGYEHTAVWFKHLANRTLLYFGIPWSKFFADIQHDMEEEEKAMFEGA